MGKPAPKAVVAPTIGRLVYLYGNLSGAKPFVGIVADVGVEGNPLTINCAAMVHSGDFVLGGLQAIPHRNDFVAGAPPTNNVFWDWMDFQKGQQAKTEELERKLEAKAGG